jgi:hypothetical protein
MKLHLDQKYKFSNHLAALNCLISPRERGFIDLASQVLQQ